MMILGEWSTGWQWSVIGTVVALSWLVLNIWLEKKR